MLDTKQSLGRPRPPARPGRQTRDAILANPLYQNITGKFVQSHDYIAMERLYEIHSSGTLRPDRGRHPAHPERHRLPRGPRAHGRLLLEPAAALAHRPVPQPRSQRRRRSPSTRWPTASSARSSSRTSPSSSSCSRRCTTASSSGPRPSTARWATAHHLRGGLHPRARSRAGGRVLHRARSTTAAPPRRPGAQQGAARPGSSTGAPTSPAALLRPRSWPSRRPRRPPRAGRARAARGRRELPQLPGGGQAGGRDRPSSAAARGGRHRPVLRPETSTTWPACSASAAVWR